MQLWLWELRRLCSLVVCNESGHMKFPFLFVALSGGELRLICPELFLNPP